MAVSSHAGKPQDFPHGPATADGALHDHRLESANGRIALPDHHRQVAAADFRHLVALTAAPLISLLDRYGSDAAAIALATETAGVPGTAEPKRQRLSALIDANSTWSSLINGLSAQLKTGDAAGTAITPQAALTVSPRDIKAGTPAALALAAVDPGDAPGMHVSVVLQGPDMLSVTLSCTPHGAAQLAAPALLDHYLTLLRHALHKPGNRVAFTPLLSDEELRRMTVEWNDTAAAVPAVRGIHEVVQNRAHEHPGDVAVAFKEERITYGELNTRANRLARFLSRQGLARGGLVGILMERHPDIIVAILAVLKAGGAYIPLDAGYPTERLAQILQDAKAAFIVTHAAHRGTIPPTGARVIDLDDPAGPPWREGGGDLEWVGSPEDTAFVLFTSGSTAQPKGVMVSHANLINYHAAWQRHCDLSGTVSAICQMAHVSFAVFQGDWVRALCLGKCLVLCSRETLASPRLLYETMRDEGADFAEFVPSLLRALYLYCRDGGKTLDFLRILAVGADRWYMREHRLLRRHCPNTRVIHVYGSSETTLDSTFFEGTSVDVPDHQLAPIGRPIMNVRAYVVDRHLQPVPVGVVGELLVGGRGVAKGYLARETLTREKFIPDPFAAEPGGRLFRTGDMVSLLPDGNIAFHGRRDHQVKIRGFRIDLGEIEQAVERYPAIREAIAHAAKTDGDEHQLVLYFVTHHGQTVELDWLRMHCQRQLPQYMIPARFVHLEALPLTASGKIDRRSLPNPWDDEPGDKTEETASPADDTVRRVVTEICCHALGRSRIEPHEDFALLGCDSMAILSMIMGIENAFGFPLDESDINQQVFSSIEAVSRFVEQRLQG